MFDLLGHPLSLEPPDFLLENYPSPLGAALVGLFDQDGLPVPASQGGQMILPGSVGNLNL